MKPQFKESDASQRQMFPVGTRVASERVPGGRAIVQVKR